MKYRLALMTLALVAIGQAQTKQKLKPKAEFVAELMAKMTPEEKIYQMVQYTSDGSVICAWRGTWRHFPRCRRIVLACVNHRDLRKEQL